MITTDQHVIDAIVLTEGCMEQAFARTGVTHIQRITSVNDVLFNEIVLDKNFDGLDTNISWDITGFEVTDQAVDQYTVTDLDSDFRQVLMRTMHRVTQLQSGNVCPTTLVEHGTGLSRFEIYTRILFFVLAFGQDFYRASQVDFFLSHNHDDARMIFRCDLPEFVTNRLLTFAFEDFFTLKFLVSGGHLELLGNLHGSKGLAFAYQSDLVADFDSGCICSGY